MYRIINKKGFTIKRFIVILTMVFILFSGCEKDNTSTKNSRKYHKIKTNSLELYFRLHPLRSSRIGIESADSTLFTFSEKEVLSTNTDINNILEMLSTLTTEGLKEKEIDNSKLILNWLQGEKLVLNELSCYKNNPVLYCWILDEALWGTPSRLSPPNENEMEYYKKRLQKIPGLLNNAKRLIDKPSQLHTKVSLSMIEELINKFDSLKVMVSKRYETDIVILDSTLKYIKDFQGFIKNDLSRRSYGKMILGSENITRIFDYDEHILTNPNMLISMAEKRIHELLLSKQALKNKLSQKAATEKPDKSDTPMDITSKFTISTMVCEISGNLARETVFTQSQNKVTKIVFTENPGRFDYYRKNPYLSTPFTGKFPIEWIPPTLHSPLSKRGYLLICRDKINPADNSLSNQPVNESFLAYSIIRAISAKKGCSPYIFTGDTLKTILCSETYKFGLLFHNIENTISRCQKRPIEIRIHDINTRILDLARVVIVIKLHSGNYSLEMAANFLIEKAGLDQKETTYNVEVALISPSIAYAGITRIMMSEMDRKLKSSDNIKLKEMSAFELLQSNPGLPIPMIRKKYFK
ncbi:hypothetical protein J7M07_02185 [bacterium]|nr:hypothetical protein [bacterium]